MIFQYSIVRMNLPILFKNLSSEINESQTIAAFPVHRAECLFTG